MNRKKRNRWIIGSLSFAAAILIVVATAATFNFDGKTVTPSRHIIDHDIQKIDNAIQLYRFHTNEYPSRLEDLVKNPGIKGWRGPYIFNRLEDAFGDPYKYVIENGIYTITSQAGGTEEGPITVRGGVSTFQKF